MSTLRRGIIKLFQIVFSISMLLIFGISLSKPLNNLVPGRMVFYTLFWVILFIVIWCSACLIEKKFPGLEKKMKYLLPVILAVYGIALYIVSCLLHSEPLTDYQDVYQAALQFARGEEVTNWDYFARWYNNVGCMLGLSLLFWLGGWLPVTVDIYYFVLLINVIQVVLMIACLYYLAGKVTYRHSLAARLMILVISFMWIPIWGNTSVFYSDQLSLGAGVFGLTLLVMGWNKPRWYLYVSSAGVIFALGAVLKVTSATIVIALPVIGFLFSAIWKNKKQLIVMLVTFAVVFMGYTMFCKTLPYQEASYRLKIPTEYWLAVGLGADGTCAGNWDFVIACATANNYDERVIMAREQIAAEIDNLWDVNHLMEKVRQNFGCGDLGSAGYLIYKDNPNFLWNLFSQEGSYYWKYACVSTSQFFAVLFMLGLGGAIRIFSKRELQEKDMLSLIIQLAFWGLCLFLMLWEAQNKQLYNHSGWMLLLLVNSVDTLFNGYQREGTEDGSRKI